MSWTLTRLRASSPVLAKAVEATTPVLDTAAPVTVDILERARAVLKTGSPSMRIADSLIARFASGAEPKPTNASRIAAQATIGDIAPSIDWTKEISATKATTFYGPRDEVHVLPNGHIAVPHENTVQVWEDQTLIKTIVAHDALVHRLYQLPTGELATLTKTELALWNADGSLRQRTTGGSGWRYFDETPHGLVLGSFDLVERYDKAGKRIDAIPCESLADLKGTPDGGFVAVTSRGQLMRYEPGKGLRTLYEQPSGLDNVERLSGGGYAATDGEYCHIFDADGQHIRAIEAVAPRRVIDLGGGRVVVEQRPAPRIYEVATGQVVQTLEVKGALTGISVLRDGRIAILSKDHFGSSELNIWDVVEQTT